MSGLLGTLGGNLKFQGWYENGTLLTSQPSGTIAMKSAHSITATWQADYSEPAAIIVGTLVVVALAGYLFMRKREIVKQPKRRIRRRTAKK